MEHNYLKTSFGKFHAAIVSPTIFLVLIAFGYEYAQGKTPFIWAQLISLAGFGLFLKAKLSIIKTGKWVTFGCDLMDQRNTNFYFAGWVLMVAGYFLSWT